MYLAYDGDKVGRKLESLLIDNDEANIEAFARKVAHVLAELEKSLLDKGCTVIFASGDSILAKANGEFDPEEIRRQYGEITFSLGVGNTPLDAMLALKKAKTGSLGSFYIYELEDKTR